MTNFAKFGAFVLAAAAVAACGGDPIDPIPTPATNKIVSTNITSNTTWYADTVYQLGGRITVTSGATLTIQPGTVIKGEAGTGSNATALLIARGGKLMAEGTASLPIIFTSVADELTPVQVAAGNISSPNLDPTVNGLWGGVLVLGNAKVSPKPGTAGELLEVQIEGIPTSDPNGLYGGNDDADNSGVIKYVSIRHGGANIGSGNEINGLTLGGVGSGTVVENIEIVANQDDGIEYFGGTVTTKNVVVWNTGDDGLDTDQSFGGTIDNFVVITTADHAMELDGPEGSYAAGHIIKNGNVIMSNADVISHDLINTDANSIVDLIDIYFTDLVNGHGTINRVSGNPGVTYTGIVLDVAAGDSLQAYVNGAIPAGVTAGSTGKANISVFGWTWANAANVIK